MKKLAGIFASIMIFMVLNTAAIAYDATRFPGKGSRADYERAMVYGRQGVSLIESGKPKEALEKFTKAAEIYPLDAGVFFNIGNCYSDLGQPNQAISNYKKAIALEPTFYEPYTNLADQYLAIKALAPALAACQKSLELAPSEPVTMATMAEILIAQKRPQEARKYLNAASNSPKTKADSSLQKVVEQDFQKLRSLEASGVR